MGHWGRGCSVHISDKDLEFLNRVETVPAQVKSNIAISLPSPGMHVPANGARVVRRLARDDVPYTQDMSMVHVHGTTYVFNVPRWVLTAHDVRVDCFGKLLV